jgi:hypothetical protein
MESKHTPGPGDVALFHSGDYEYTCYNGQTVSVLGVIDATGEGAYEVRANDGSTFVAGRSELTALDKAEGK